MSSPDNINLRLATGADAATVHTLVVKLAQQTRAQHKVTSQAGDFANAMSGDPPAMHVILAERAHLPLGIAVFFLTYSTWRGSAGVYLQDIYVSEDARGSGLGKRLLGAVATWASEHGADHLRLEVDRDNKAAQSFYEHMGLCHRAEEMTYAAVGEAFFALAGKMGQRQLL